MKKISIDRIIETGSEETLGLYAMQPEEEAGERQQVVWAGQFFDRMLPPTSLPGRRRMVVGYRRFMALAWLVRRECTGCSNVTELSQEMGVSERAAYKILAEVKGICGLQ